MNQPAITKGIIIGVLVLAVTGLVIFKVATGVDQTAKVEPDQTLVEITPAPLADQSEPGNDTEEKNTENSKTDSARGPVVLVTVNLRQITEPELEERYQSLPDDYKSAYKNNKEGLLDQIIIEEVLYQEAVRRGYGEKNAGTLSQEQKMDIIRKLITAVSDKITVSERELREFYDTHPAEVQGASYDQIKESIREYLTGQKQNEAVDQLIADLKQKARITYNQEWLAKQAALKPQNPLTKALKNGMPTVLDMGSGTCIPCKMMKPIFEELEKEYQGRANIILLDVNDYRDLSTQYQVRVIPTQIFFDKQGKQVWRHEGYLAKEDIVKKLKELGV